MATVRHLPRAPIREALLDIAIDSGDDFDMSQLLGLKDRLPFVVVEEPHTLHVLGGLIDMKELQFTAEDAQMIGYRFTSKELVELVQARINRFTYNRLSPYTNWDDIQQRAQEAWENYRSIRQPREINRIALRYINELVIPLMGDDPATYFVFHPQTPPGAKLVVAGFNYVTTVLDQAQNLGAHIRVSTKSIEVDNMTVVLDIDAFSAQQLGPTSVEVWDVFEKIHLFKNDIFFSYITDKLAETYI